MTERCVRHLKGVDISVLAHRLVYDPNTGVFRHQNSPYPSYNGKIAGSTNSYGYRVIKVGGKYLLAHQIAWLLVKGVAPAQPIDHRDGERDNNRIDNLRLATAAQNGANRRVAVNSALGAKGVSVSPNGRFRVRIRVNNRKRRVGTFGTYEEAVGAYNKAAEHHFGEFARPNVV